MSRNPTSPRAVLQALGAGVLTLDLSARITSVNPWAEHLLGRSAPDMIGHDAHDLLHRHADGSPVLRERCALRNPAARRLRRGGRRGVLPAGGRHHGSDHLGHHPAGQGRPAGRARAGLPRLQLAPKRRGGDRGAHRRPGGTHHPTAPGGRDLHRTDPSEHTSATLRRPPAAAGAELGQWARRRLPGAVGRPGRVAVSAAAHPHRSGRLRGPVTSLPDPPAPR
ncbi:PAS domain-containing protein [Streptomyces thinghirensis]|nr:PAS domain-containing protein [Streptomyces thinghirensis]